MVVGLHEYEKAITDLQSGLALSPGDSACKQLLAKTRSDFAEYVKQQQISQLMKKYVFSPPSSASSSAAVAAEAEAGEAKARLAAAMRSAFGGVASASASAARRRPPSSLFGPDTPNHNLHPSSPLCELLCTADRY
jgi:hypothetical protein